MINKFLPVVICALMVMATTSSQAQQANDAFTLPLSGGNKIEYKNFSVGGNSAIVLSLSLLNSHIDLNNDYTDPFVEDYKYSQANRTVALGIGYRKYLSTNNINTFIDVIPSIAKTRMKTKLSSSESTANETSAYIELMFGAEYHFNENFGMEGKFGVSSTKITNTSSGDIVNTDSTYKEFTTINSGILMNFYF